MANREIRAPTEWMPYVALLVALSVASVRQVTASSSDSAVTPSPLVGNLQATKVDSSVLDSTPNPITTPTPRLILAGGSSTIYLQNRGFQIDEKEDYACLNLEVVTDGALQDVRVTSQGLGEIVLWNHSPDSWPDCSEATGGLKDQLMLGDLTASSPIFVRIGPLILHGSGKTLEGKIVVSASGIPAVEFPLRVEKPPLATHWILLGRSLGIIIPAVLAALLTYAGSRAIKAYEGREARKKELDEFLQSQSNTIAQFFRDYYPTICEDNKNNPSELASKIETELNNFKILNTLPWQVQRELRVALDSEDPQEIVVALLNAFPLWKKHIHKNS